MCFLLISKSEVWLTNQKMIWTHSFNEVDQLSVCVYLFFLLCMFLFVCLFVLVCLFILFWRFVCMYVCFVYADALFSKIIMQGITYYFVHVNKPKHVIILVFRPITHQTFCQMVFLRDVYRLGYIIYVIDTLQSSFWNNLFNIAHLKVNTIYNSKYC